MVPSTACVRVRQICWMKECSRRVAPEAGLELEGTTPAMLPDLLVESPSAQMQMHSAGRHWDGSMHSAGKQRRF